MVIIGKMIPDQSKGNSHIKKERNVCCTRSSPPALVLHVLCIKPNQNRKKEKKPTKQDQRNKKLAPAVL